MSEFFPPGLTYVVSVDTTPFVRLSIESVVHTLFEAVVLVFVVMFLFLQNFRATLIPTIAAPVVLLGVFGVLAVVGFTINTLTMFGMVLAIGLLVDDAIVVVENVERVMAEEGLSPKEAAKKSMGQITSALLGVTTVLSAVFLPMAFFGGSVGAIYRQFSITIASAMILSLLVAMTLTPALCATMLKPAHHGERKGFFGWFNRTYDRGASSYGGVVQKLLGMRGRAMLGYFAIVAAMAVLFVRLPSAFLPEEDQGQMMAMVTLPTGSTLEQTKEVMAKVDAHLLTEESASVESVMSVVGFNFGGRGQNNGMAFIRLKDWSERKGKEQTAQALAARVSGALSQIKQGLVFTFTPPAVSELGTATGFDLQIQDRAGHGHEALIQARNQLLGAAAKNPAVTRVRPAGQEDMTQYKIDIDQEKARALGVSLADVNQTLATAWGGAYVNDFVDRGRVKKVFMQADAPYRMQPEDLDRWRVRNNRGEMVPYSAFATGHWTYGSPRLERFNGLPAVQIQGEAAPGRSSGEAMAAMAADRRRASAGLCARVVGAVVRGAALRLAGAGALRASRCSSSSSASPRSTRAGRCRSRSCWWCRSASSARSARRSSSACGTTSFFQVGLLTTIGLVCEERHPHRRVRARAPGARQGAHRGDRGGVAHAPASHLDDVARLHPRRAAARHLARRGLGRPERDRHRRHRRHDLGHRPGGGLRAGLLRRGHGAVRSKERAASACPSSARPRRGEPRGRAAARGGLALRTLLSARGRRDP